MTYQVLARKWRPRSFREMAGQGHVLKTLVNSLDNDRLHHAYLFTGTRGVGKTTIARILAKCLNCEEGVSSQPCGQCGACREIDQGRFIDLIEVDAASRTKVEDTRELLDNVQYSPSRGRFKVYLIDEVHMLSGHSFNALLKTLEEPPPHVKFLLATTDPQKLPVTVLSRCLQFNLKNLSPEQLVTHLRHVLEQEAIPFEDPALWQLGHAAKGSVRDSLTLLDQAISYGGGKVSESEVRALLGTIDRAIIHKLVDALAAADAAGLLAVVEGAADHAPDFSLVLEDLLGYLHRVAVAQVVPKGVDNSQGDRDMVLAHARALPAENVQLFYQIALKGRAELPLAVDARAGLEMTLLRMLAFTPDGVPNSPTVPLGESRAASQAAPQQESPADEDRAKKKSAGISPEHGLRKAPEVPAARPAPWEDGPPPPEAAPAPPQRPVPPPVPPQRPSSPTRLERPSSPSPAVPTAQPAPEPRFQPAPEPAPAPPAQEPPRPESPPRPRINLAELVPSQWITLFHALDLRGITKSIAANCVLKSADGAHIVLVLDESQSSVFSDEHRKRIQDALGAFFDCPVDLRMESGTPEAETPAQYRKRKEKERLREAVQTFENDAVVREIVERFSGTILSESIEPLTPKQF